MTDKARTPWLSKLTSREQAETMRRECALVMLFLAALHGALAFMHGPSLLIQAVLLGGGGGWLLARRSRMAATALLLAAAGGAALAVGNQSGHDLPGGKNLMLALLVLWTAIKSVEATFRLQGRYAYAAVAQPADAPV